MNGAEWAQRYRARHPDRAKLTAQINNARNMAARRVANRYPDQWETETQAECRKRGIPRWLPALPTALDARGGGA